MPIKCEVTADKRMIFSGTSKKRYWHKNKHAYNSLTEYNYDEKQFIEDMGFEWLGYDDEEGRGLWGGPIWTDGNYYWTYERYALESFLHALRSHGSFTCELSQWENYVQGIPYIFTDASDARFFMRSWNVTDWYKGTEQEQIQRAQQLNGERNLKDLENARS